MKRIRALMVEDSQFAADINARHIKRSGFEVEYKVVSNSRDMAEALNKCEWDIIISDNCMPEFSALGAMEIWSRSGMRIPFVVASEYMTNADVSKAYSFGLTAFISKSDLIELGILVQKLFNK